MIIHPELRDISKDEKRKKIYSVISIVSLCFPFFIIGILAMYMFVMDKEIELNAWFSLVIIIPLILCSIFDIKSKRIK